MTAVLETPPARPTRRRGRVIAVFSALTALLLLAHPLVPNWVGNAGSLLETFLPWTGLLVLPLLVAALVRRSALALVSLLLPALVWGGSFGGRLFDRTAAGGDFTIVSHNVNDENPDLLVRLSGHWCRSRPAARPVQPFHARPRW